MSEYNDGGLAERGGGGLANPGGPNTAGGGGGQANRSGMGLGVNSGMGWANNPYRNTTNSGGLAASIAAYNKAQAQARARARVAATQAQPPVVDPVTGQPLPGAIPGYNPLGSASDWGIGWPDATWGGPLDSGVGPGGHIGGYAGSISQAGTSSQPNYGGPRQFGGPIIPGQQYTVGENGPETLNMGSNGVGQVTPMNPADRLAGGNPQMQQAIQQLKQWHMNRPRPQISPGPVPMRQPFQVGSPNLALRGFAA